MDYADLFGEGTVYQNGILSIPRTNLEAIGLAPNSQDLVSIVTAILLVVENYFIGSIADSDGAILIDDNGNSLGYNQNRVEMTVNFEYVGKELNLTETKLFWNYLSFFT